MNQNFHFLKYQSQNLESDITKTTKSTKFLIITLKDLDKNDLPEKKVYSDYDRLV